MRILAIETTERIPTVAGVESGGLLLQRSLDPDRRSVQSLALGMRGLLDEVGWAPRDVELVAVAVGPGSFTGIRVGVTTAKTFAYAVKAEVLGIDALEAIAFGCPNNIAAVSAAVDAQRREVMARLFRRDEAGRLQPAGGAALLPVETWLSDIPEGAELAGPILRKLPESRRQRLPTVDPACWIPCAAAVGLLADRKYREGARNSIWDLLPVYSRPSAAEEKALAARRRPILE